MKHKTPKFYHGNGYNNTHIMSVIPKKKPKYISANNHQITNRQQLPVTPIESDLYTVHLSKIRYSSTCVINHFVLVFIVK
jgi:hypothetical protein